MPGVFTPDATPMAIPMLDEGSGPLSFDSDPSVNPPTMPMSAKLALLAARIGYEQLPSKQIRKPP